MKIRNIVEASHHMGNWLKDNRGRREFRSKKKQGFGSVLEREVTRTDDGGIFIGGSVTKAEILKVEELVRMVEI